MKFLLMMRHDGDLVNRHKTVDPELACLSSTSVIFFMPGSLAAHSLSHNQ